MLNYLKKKFHKRMYNFHIRKARKYHASQQELLAEGYHSQRGQDKLIHQTYYKNSKPGVFVDIGANDGVTYSNTLFFEKTLGWKGVAIEPIPATFEKLKSNRSCDTVNACVGPTDGEVEFLVIEGPSEMLSGIIDNYDARHLERIKDSQEKHGDKTKKIMIPSLRLESIMKNTPFNKIDYLNIDTEGGEFEILKSIDFSKYEIDTISVENNYKETRFSKYMDSVGYDLVARAGDEIYRRRGA